MAEPHRGCQCGGHGEEPEQHAGGHQDRRGEPASRPRSTVHIAASNSASMSPESARIAPTSLEHSSRRLSRRARTRTRRAVVIRTSRQSDGSRSARGGVGTPPGAGGSIAGPGPARRMRRVQGAALPSGRPPRRPACPCCRRTGAGPLSRCRGHQPPPRASARPELHGRLRRQPHPRSRRPSSAAGGRVASAPEHPTTGRPPRERSRLSTTGLSVPCPWTSPTTPAWWRRW